MIFMIAAVFFAGITLGSSLFALQGKSETTSSGRAAAAPVNGAAKAILQAKLVG